MLLMLCLSSYFLINESVCGATEKRRHSHPEVDGVAPKESALVVRMSALPPYKPFTLRCVHPPRQQRKQKHKRHKSEHKGMKGRTEDCSVAILGAAPCSLTCPLQRCCSFSVLVTVHCSLFSTALSMSKDARWSR
ncbi:hypothetical protein SODALDRAFT_19240 [Sodiomyces alkalinus F11]|uniref:Secreted protein n=1 Tax=Sodiomyces alkalinus (strain CBS 110278 / VKM F-3762 / F11) TaxID=1314773 RepID=A0A3N2Q746_SODAK|nr:hypothetical protein SODALDRAFT_19240 [Sodiomyces alkalinus F11]ROT42609.1 hypothetical protein SODALDRAFT_19240 [Sodiomyces alkalinus F11]